jgi:hypothetical protein
MEPSVVEPKLLAFLHQPLQTIQINLCYCLAQYVVEDFSYHPNLYLALAIVPKLKQLKKLLVVTKPTKLLV